MSWIVYIVRCADDTLYTGVTTNLPRRLQEHNVDNRLGSKFVRVRRPVVLVYSELTASKSSALKRELEIKGWSRNKKITLIEGHIQTI